MAFLRRDLRHSSVSYALAAQVYRHREGFTRAEAADLEALFDQLAQQNEKAKQISRPILWDDIGWPLLSGSLAACNCLHRLGYKALHNEHQLLFAEARRGG